MDVFHTFHIFARGQEQGVHIVPVVASCHKTRKSYQCPLWHQKGLILFKSCILDGLWKAVIVAVLIAHFPAEFIDRAEKCVGKTDFAKCR